MLVEFLSRPLFDGGGRRRRDGEKFYMIGHFLLFPSFLDWVRECQQSYNPTSIFLKMFCFLGGNFATRNLILFPRRLCWIIGEQSGEVKKGRTMFLTNRRNTRNVGARIQWNRGTETERPLPLVSDCRERGDDICHNYGMSPGNIRRAGFFIRVRRTMTISSPRHCKIGILPQE